MPGKYAQELHAIHPCLISNPPITPPTFSVVFQRIDLLLDEFKAEKKIEFTTHDRPIDTPRPRYIRRLKN